MWNNYNYFNGIIIIINNYKNIIKWNNIITSLNNNIEILIKQIVRLKNIFFI